MVDIQSVIAENRSGKKEEKTQWQNILAVLLGGMKSNNTA